MKWYRKMKIIIAAICMTILLLSGCGNESSLETKNEAATDVNTDEQNKGPESEEESMTIKVNEMEYNYYIKSILSQRILPLA